MRAASAEGEAEAGAGAGDGTGAGAGAGAARRLADGQAVVQLLNHLPHHGGLQQLHKNVNMVLGWLA
ncbi:MAG: hypothetical protein R2857_09295 [Vampirovibrionales bacterium]